MKKSLPALRFISRLSIHPSVIIIILFLLLICPVTNTQKGVYPVGKAPISELKIIPQGNSSLAIGTRAFHLISSSPTFQLGKSFMETCNITNIGAPFTMTSPGGLVFRNGQLFTWNMTSPYQFYSVDTVTGIRTLFYNITGVPLTNLTGLCWDGTTMWGVATNLSSSQIFTFNMTTGACTPVGVPSSVCPGAVCLFGRMFAGSSLYSYDMVNDDLYRWSKTTGIATLIGPAGFTINPGMGACFDGNTAYINANSQLRRWDTTGSSVILCTYSSNPIGIACVPASYYPGNVTILCKMGIFKTVNDHSTVRDTITLIGSGMIIKDINIRIDTFNHTWDSDMVFSLSHNSITIPLITNRGGSGDNFIGTVLNDSALLPISSGTAPFTGVFRPEQPLTPYIGMFANGHWILTMEDQVTGDTGTLKSWCIVVEWGHGIGGINETEIPFAYRLYQNYPNPFNPVTTIKYGLPKYGNTKLVVYDILGKVVSILVDNELKDAGTYEVEWDSSNFSSGIYFYTLESGSFKETKKMVLIK